jgi:hypothetical protein
MVKDQEAKMPKDAPAEQKKMMGEMTTKMSGVLVKACTDDKWSKEAIECGVKAKDPEKECEKLITKEQKDKLDKAFEAAMGMGMGGGDEGTDEGTAAATGEGTAAATGEGTAAATGEGTAAATGDQAAAGGGSSGLPECDEYVAAMDKYLQCDKIPQATRDAAKQGMDAMKAGWADMGSLPDDVKKQAADGCKQAVDALKQGATALGCTL